MEESGRDELNLVDQEGVDYVEEELSCEYLEAGSPQADGSLGEEYVLVQLTPKVERMLGMNNRDESVEQNNAKQEQRANISCEIVEHSDEPIWINRFASARDIAATKTFINLVGSEKYQSLLSDRLMPKSKVWEQVYEKMTHLGYNIADNVMEGGLKCSQKWRNLERSYMQFVVHVRSGEDKRKIPAYYELLHPLLKDKPKVANVEQKLSCRKQPDASSSSSEDNYTATCESTSVATSQDILDFVIAEAERQEKRFTKLCDLLEKQNEEKKRLTDAIVKYLGQSIPRKRKACELNSD